MRKQASLILASIIILTQFGFAQVAKNSWGLGFGFGYPYLNSTNVSALSSNYGGYLTLQRNFSEQSALRLVGGYSHIEGEFTNNISELQTSETNLVFGNLDFLYYPAPCGVLSPYLLGGVGAAYRTLKNYATTTLDEKKLVGELNAGAGIEIKLGSWINLSTEFSYHYTNNSELDGALGAGEINGRDTYLSIKTGIYFFLSKGEPSDYCNLFEGIRVESKPDNIDYNRIEKIVETHIPKEITKEVVVEKTVPVTMAGAKSKWILIGVNFESGSDKLKTEAYPILFDAAKTLLENPELEIEIQGYTDNIGSDRLNNELSLKRANTVKRYLVSKGVEPGRLSASGYGENSPLISNSTPEGREMNRRIEFKIVGGVEK